MSDSPKMNFQQRASQKMERLQKMSRSQIMSLKLLSMSAGDMRGEIYSQAEKNPALRIKSDPLESGVSSSRVEETNVSRFSDNTRYARTDAKGNAASDNFQAALESNADDRETLAEHLEHQLNSMSLPDEERALCLRLIHNLDEKGFHILAPVSLLDKSNPCHGETFLRRCIGIVQRMDPAGTCASGYLESLLVQAKISGKASPLTIFLLESHEHFSFLSPPQIQKIQKKISDCLSEQEKLRFGTRDGIRLTKDDISPDKIGDALNFIRTLDPYPARNFGVSRTNFIAPDVIVKKNPGDGEPSVMPAREFLPRLEISKEYISLIGSTKIKDGDVSEKSERKKAELRFARDSVSEARLFIDSVAYRESTILKAAREIVRAQALFFENGPGHLAPLRQRDIAERLKVHETTISRMASSKYLECEWGIFPISYFFTNAVGEKKESGAGEPESSQKTGREGVSKEAVKYEMAEILRSHEDGKKPLSDQKISELLAKKGINVARRTVAKYRSELSIGSSYGR